MSDRDELIRRATIGFTALVDEATGYQNERPASELEDAYRNMGGDLEALLAEPLVLERLRTAATNLP